MENLERILGEHPFLKGLSQDQIAVLAGCASNVVFKAGEFVFREGEPANAFFFIRQGKVQVETHIPQKGTVIIRSRSDDEGCHPTGGILTRARSNSRGYWPSTANACAPSVKQTTPSAMKS